MLTSFKSHLTGRSQAGIYQLRRKAELANVHYPIFQTFMVYMRNMHPATQSRAWAHSPLTCPSQRERSRSLHFGWEGFPWAFIPAGPKPTLTPPAAQLSSARQDLQLCLSTSSLSGPLHFWSIFSTVTCCLMCCNTLYSARVAESFCCTNSATEAVLEKLCTEFCTKTSPTPFPTLPGLAPVLVISDALNKRQLPVFSEQFCLFPRGCWRGGHCISCCNYTSQGHILPELCWSIFASTKGSAVAEQAEEFLDILQK